MTEQLNILLQSRQLEAISVLPDEVSSAWEKAVITLRNSALTVLDTEPAFTLTYQAALQCSAAALRGAGYRAIGRDHHHNTFAGVVALEEGDLSRTVRQLDRMRLVRHDAVYGIEVMIQPEQLHRLRELTERLFDNAHTWLSAVHPQLTLTPPGVRPD